MTKRIVLCADDYGQAPAISKGIVDLVQKQRLTATSCMVNSSYWLEHAAWIKPFKSNIDIGLHFNLTEGMALSAPFIQAYGERLPALSVLLKQAFFRQLDDKVIAAELNAQLDFFVAGMGGLPDFIDGHQHIHQFPVIRDALLHVYQQRLQDKKPYMRLVKQKMQFKDGLTNIKKMIITATGTYGFQRLLAKNNISHNHSFAGVYAFKQSEDYATLFPQFLQEIESGGIIMCHPGLDGNVRDEIADARVNEYNYFNSEQFNIDCQTYRVILEKRSSLSDNF